jgi:hypothetical protein
LRALKQIDFSRPEALRTGRLQEGQENKAKKEIAMIQQSPRYVRWLLLSQILWTVPLGQCALAQVSLPPNFISPNVPHDVPAGSNASIQDLAVFAWQEFVALNWPSVDPQTTGLRGTADTSADFVSVKKDSNGSFPLLVWHTYQHKNELFPADGMTNPSFDSKAPVYKYKAAPTAGASNPSFSLFNNLDETSQIGLCNMFSHTSIRIAYEAKVSRALFDYANTNSLTKCDNKNNCPALVAATTKTLNNLPQYGGTCSTDPSIISLPCGDAAVTGNAGEGAIEIKAAWRQLTTLEAASGRFFVRNVIFYTGDQYVNEQYQNAVWGLVALHIIHKTKSFPTYVFATWEQVDNYDDQTNQNTQDLVFQNTGTNLPNIPVTRAHPIHSQIPPVNTAVHAAFMAKDPSTIWQYYKLVGVQASLVKDPPPANSPVDDLSYYYLANIVVETNQVLQNFTGKAPNGIIVQPFNNIYVNGDPQSPYQMGGCKGCHGTQGQNIGGDMSVLIGRGPSNTTPPPESIDAGAVESVKSNIERSFEAMHRK